MPCFVAGHDATARCVCILASVAFQEAKINYEEKHNKAIFVKNIISDNILPGDIYVRAKELHFATDVPRAVLLIRQTERTDMAALEAISNMFPDRQKDFVLSINETDLVLIKELTGPADSDEEVYDDRRGDREEAARRSQSQDVSSASARRRTIVRELADAVQGSAGRHRGRQGVRDRRNPSSTTKTSASAGSSISFPPHSARCSCARCSRRTPIEALDQETLYTINKFFENNLNVSETSRKLFVHRNTLVYRLEKIKKLTGLDLREFDHAIIFKVALMVKKYLDTRQNARRILTAHRH